MAQPYVGEIRMFAGNFPPVGWMFCDGTPLPISQNETLFQLIGTAFGGDGESTFNLPDLQSRVPVHQGSTRPYPSNGGVEEVTLTINQIPAHTHPLLPTTNSGTTVNAATNYLAEAPSINIYIEDSPAVSLNANSISPVGGSQPHTNLQPFLCINFIISLFGIFPSQT